MLKELYEKRAKLVQEMRDYEGQNRANWTADCEGRWNEMNADVDKLTGEIRRLERVQALEAEEARAAESNGNRFQGDPTPGNGEARSIYDTQEYRHAFESFLRTGDQTEMRTLNITVNPNGGYLVPDEFYRNFIRALDEYFPFRQACTVITTNSDVKIPIDNKAGVAYWVAEEGTRQETQETFGQLMLDGHWESYTHKVSLSLLQDSVFDIAGYLNMRYVEAFSVLEEAGFTTGNGVGKPRGFLDNATLGVTTAVNNVIESDDLMDLLYSVKSGYRRRGRFLADDTTIGYIRKMKDGFGNYLWAAGLQPGQPDMLLGKPIDACNSMDAIGSAAKVIAFGDFSYYYIVDRGRPVIQRLVELYAATGQQGFIMQKRVDGLLTLPEAVKYIQMAV